jgi:galactoside O-acetyltransferase
MIYMGERVKKRLRYCGQNVTIHPLAKICRPEVVHIGNFTTVGDYTFMWGGQGIIIGEHCHIQVRSSVWGGGRLMIGNYVSVGLHSVLLTAVYNHKDGKHMVDHVTNDLQAETIFGELIIEDDVYIGAHCTILPVKIGQGAIIGAGSVVIQDVNSHGIYVGSPARQIGIRPKLEMTK